MSKSIYSLALTDEVVAALDLMARRQGLSRSALADRILADYASCVTNENRNRRIFDGVAEALEQDYRFGPYGDALLIIYQHFIRKNSRL